jgi:hypothetical protein
MWLPVEPVAVGDEPERKPTAETPVRPSRLLPIVQCLAEGGLLAVIAAAVQAVFGEVPIIGPFEFAILAGIGMAWARRRRWRSPAWEAFGLPLIAVAAGALCWLISPEVRIAILSGTAGDALGAHPGGWVGAVAVYRGHAHHAREVDEEVQDNLMRWGLPALALAWLVGDLAARQAGPEVRDAFTAVAFLGSIVFVGAGVLALGLARLASVRGEGSGGGSWFGFALVVALGITLIGIPAGALLGVPLETLLIALVAPIRVIGALLVLVLSPVVVLAALVVELVQPILPEGFGQGTITLPEIDVGIRQPDSPLPGILFYVAFLVIILIELAAVGFYLWWRWRQGREMASLTDELAEERSVVFDRPPRPPREPRAAPPPRRDRRDPVGAYLMALEALAADGRWPRRDAETPRHHAARVEVDTPGSPVAAALSRLAAGYQLLRYAGRPLSAREQARTADRLARLERALRQSR